MVPSLQCIFQSLLLTIVFTCLHGIYFSTKFVSLRDNLSYEIVLKFLLDVSGEYLVRG